MPNSYEHSYQHNLDDVIDASDAVLAIGTEKVDTTTLKDRSLNNHDATIHGAMRTSGYFDGGRRFAVANENYIDCGNIPTFGNGDFIIHSIVRQINSTGVQTIINTYGGGVPYITNFIGTGIIRTLMRDSDGNLVITDGNGTIQPNTFNVVSFIRHSGFMKMYVNGILQNDINIDILGSAANAFSFSIGKQLSGDSKCFNGIIVYIRIVLNPINNCIDFFNILARLPLYSHNFERYPNSDTSLTSVFPYTSGIIISGSFNKTDGLKCTSAGQIIFSNSFEFDGSEYITLIIDGIEYSGTTTVTQGTITATIAQGSNDITIDMGMNDVLEDIRVQFRETV